MSRTANLENDRLRMYSPINNMNTQGIFYTNHLTNHAGSYVGTRFSAKHSNHNVNLLTRNIQNNLYPPSELAFQRPPGHVFRDERDPQSEPKIKDTDQAVDWWDSFNDGATAESDGEENHPALHCPPDPPPYSALYPVPGPVPAVHPNQNYLTGPTTVGIRSVSVHGVVSGSDGTGILAVIRGSTSWAILNPPPTVIGLGHRPSQSNSLITPNVRPAQPIPVGPSLSAGNPVTATNTCMFDGCGALLLMDKAVVFNHMRQAHSPPKTFEFDTMACRWDGCGKEMRLVNISRHVVDVHFGLLGMQCDECLETFSRTDSLRRHELHSCFGVRSNRPS